MKRIYSGSPYEEKIGYCRAIISGDWVFVSGTVAVADPDTGLFPETAAEQCQSVLTIIKKALSEVQCDWDDVVRVRYILSDAQEFESCWPVLQKVFKENPPAATMIEAGLIDPKYKIEIEATAHRLK